MRTRLSPISKPPLPRPYLPDLAPYRSARTIRWATAARSGQSGPVALHYIRRRWDESRGDSYDAWGPATYWFEVDDGLVPLRQIETYDGGQRLLYDQLHIEDDYGSLATVSLEGWDGGDPWAFEVTRAEFDAEWSRGRRTDRPRWAVAGGPRPHISHAPIVGPQAGGRGALRDRFRLGWIRSSPACTWRSPRPARGTRGCGGTAR